jgi:hypothetical protein
LTTLVAGAGVVVALVLGGCGESQTEATRGQEGQEGRPGEVPSEFAVGSEGRWGFIGATSTHLVGLADSSDRFGQVVDLETGATTEIAPPPYDGGESVSPLAVVAGDDHVTITALALDPGVGDEGGPPVSGSGSAPPSTLLSYRLDPRTATWEVLDLPESLVGAQGWAFRAMAASGSDGAAAVFDLDDGGGRILAVLHGTAWEEIGRLPAGREDQWCATDTEWWQLTAEDRPDEERTAEAPYPATVGLMAASLTDGEARDVAAPPVMTEFGGAGVRLACSGDAAFIGTSVGGSTPTAVHTYDGQAWRTYDDPFGTQEILIATVANGGAAGPAFGASVIDHSAEPGSQGTTLAFDEAGEPQLVDDNTAGTDVVWKGRTTSYLLIGDVTGEGDDEQPATVTLREVDL